ncbi:MAG: diguanylate cyclase [Oscillospiraceae bacterium]|nr:diguanylate cyclase [Oscillospiraceae bacterium]
MEVRANLWLEQGHPGSLLLLDAIHSSQVNDRWGHLAGDALPHQAAHILSHMITKTIF